MTSYPPDISTQEGERLTEVVKDWSLAHGLTVRPPPAVIAAESDPGNILATAVPVTLFPSPFPRSCFEQAVHVQKAYNELYASISQDEGFLAQIVKEIGDSDEFTQNLWKVHLRVKEEGYVQNLSLGLFRSDYMVHQEASGAPQIKQVEFNTIAASFGGLSSQTSLLHRYLSTTEYPLIEGLTPGKVHHPENHSTKGLAAGIRQAFLAYGEPATSHPKCVLFLVQGGERNIFDQKHLEYDVQAPPTSVPVFRLPVSETLQHTRLAAEGDGRQLLYTPPQRPHLTFEVAVVYMRCGYGPDDYPDQSAWDARYHVERSAAIKCPSVLTQVAGTKKVQQVLATPTDKSKSTPPVLYRFLSPATHPKSIGELEATFTNIFPLDDTPAGLEARKLALDPEQCTRYVLKPQREGGGNNVYRSAIPGFLSSIPEAHWGAYILMELITPPPVRNTILRNGKLERGGVICELGIYGTCLWDQTEREGRGVRWNEQAGYLLRTKGDKSEEGGVAAGFGCMDSVALV